MDADILATLTNIKFIGQIKQGDKIDASNKYLQQNGFLTGMWRYFFGGNREQTYNYMIEWIEKAFVLLNETSDEMIKEELIQYISDCIIGLDNFKKTYSKDVLFSSKLEVLITRIKHTLQNPQNPQNVQNVQKLRPTEQISQPVEPEDHLSSQVSDDSEPDFDTDFE